MTLDAQPSETSQKPAPLCPVGKSASQMKVPRLYRQEVTPCPQGCRCSSGLVTKGLDGNPRGGCIKPLIEPDFEDAENGWCFLENVQVMKLSVSLPVWFLFLISFLPLSVHDVSVEA